MSICNWCGAENADPSGRCRVCGREMDVGGVPVPHPQQYRAPGELGPPSGRYFEEEPQGRSVTFKVVVTVTVVAAMAVAFLAYRYYNRVPDPVPSVKKPQAIDISAGPRQTPVEDQEQFYVSYNRTWIAPVANYELAGEVLDKSVNRGYGDEEAMFPLDLAVGWGSILDTDVESYVELGYEKTRKFGQFLNCRIDLEEIPPTVDQKQIMTHISNTHILPATENIYNAIVHLEKGQKVLLRGYLVNARNAQGAFLNTSRDREDMGAGACECMYVNQIQVEDLVFE